MQCLFLDLEDTIITPVVQGWNNTELINVHKIQNFIKSYQPDTLNIFSFAIHDDYNYRMFKTSGTLDMIERALGMEIQMIPTVERMIIKYAQNMKLHRHSLDFIEFVQLIGKQNAFRHYVYSLNQKDNEYVLLDDVVVRESFRFKNISGEIYNINEDI